MNVYTYPKDIAPDPKGHLVSTAKCRNDESAILIHTSGQNTTNHFCNVFYVTTTGEECNFLENQYSVDYESSMERGWFRDIALFIQICQSQTAEDPKNWPLRVLATIEREYKDFWLGIHYDTLPDDASSGNEETVASREVGCLG